MAKRPVKGKPDPLSIATKRVPTLGARGRSVSLLKNYSYETQSPRPLCS